MAKTSRPTSSHERGPKKSTSPQLLPRISGYDFDSDETEKITIETRWSRLDEAVSHSEFSASPVERALHKRTQAVASRFDELKTSHGRAALMLEIDDIYNTMAQLGMRFDAQSEFSGFSEFSGVSQPPLTEPEGHEFTRPRKAARPKQISESQKVSVPEEYEFTQPRKAPSPKHIPEPQKNPEPEEVSKPKKVSRSRRMWDGVTQIVKDTSWANRKPRRNSGDSVYPKLAYLYDP